MHALVLRVRFYINTLASLSLANKWHNIKRSPLDVSQVKTEVEGLRNSEHRLSKVGIAT